MKRTLLALAIAGLSVAAYASPPPGGGPPGPIDVNVTNPVLPVEVSNDEPIPVVATTPSGVVANRYQRSWLVDAWSNSGTTGYSNITISSSSLGIPSDKILVVESAYAEALVNPGDKAYVEIVCQGASPDVTISVAYVRMPLTSAGTYSGYERLIGGGAILCYAGSDTFIMFYRDSAVAAYGYNSGRISLIGYLVDKPQ